MSKNNNILTDLQNNNITEKYSLFLRGNILGHGK